MIKLRVVGFASGSPLSIAAMARMARDHTLCGIVTPRVKGNWINYARRRLADWRSPLTQLGAPLIDIADITHCRPDTIVVASFPEIIPASVLAIAPAGAFNIHMSLLPRHRGVDPIFWTYWHDDALAGVSTHWMADGIDNGAIAAQDAVPLQRGLPSRALYMQLLPLGVDQLTRTLAQLGSRTPPKVAQDNSLASHASTKDIAGARIPFAQWNAERVWHVLSGLGDQRTGLIQGVTSTSTTPGLPHGRASGYRASTVHEPGRIDVIGSGYELHCSDGIVSVQGRR